jgi:antitoxin (DNA-binding transcriptional repressor) of toxin-antitoxin stability system
MTKVNMLEAKTHLSRLVGAIEDGSETEVIIQRNGKPVARLVAIATKSDASKRLGIAEGLFPPMTLEEFNEQDEEIAKLFLADDSQEW